DETYLSRTVVEFTAGSTGSTFIDLIAASVSFVEINGQTLSPAEVFDGARVTFPVRAGRNALTIEAQARYSTSGEGLHRFTDPADGKVYLYTQYEPTDARRVFANFDQPDLKAEFSFSVTAPAHFQVLSNRPEADSGPAEPHRAEADTDAGGDVVTHRFLPTLRESTYITCVPAGPYEGGRDGWPAPNTGQPVQLAARPRARRVLHLHASGSFSTAAVGPEVLAAECGYAHARGKYDQVFLPEYDLGAMESPGLVAFRDPLTVPHNVMHAIYQL